jgi:hypothetical protein
MQQHQRILAVALASRAVAAVGCLAAVWGVLARENLANWVAE